MINDSNTFDRLVTEQIAYYRARAPEYDEWFLRQGRYDRGSEANGVWFQEVEEIVEVLKQFGPSGQILELAAGTGLWTQRLVPNAKSITVVDAAPEVLAINRERVGSSSVRYVEADLFAWRPDRRFDVVFFGFWLSHVPPDRFEDFWTLVGDCVSPGGRFFFVDSRFNPESTARDQRLESPNDRTAHRRLNDGREYEIVKIFYQPEQLAQQLSELGWRTNLRTTASHFIYGWGTKTSSSR
ncbi:MAG TPA: class I SAM-dependent methyltransferase [Chloroflexota bacterium]|nr:class I SAM-dependent methyltransferase [Chloroflexota bacterium]